MALGGCALGRQRYADPHLAGLYCRALELRGDLCQQQPGHRSEAAALLGVLATGAGRQSAADHRHRRIELLPWLQRHEPRGLWVDRAARRTGTAACRTPLSATGDLRRDAAARRAVAAQSQHRTGLRLRHLAGAADRPPDLGPAGARPRPEGWVLAAARLAAAGPSAGPGTRQRDPLRGDAQGRHSRHLALPAGERSDAGGLEHAAADRRPVRRALCGCAGAMRGQVQGSAGLVLGEPDGLDADDPGAGLEPGGALCGAADGAGAVRRASRAGQGRAVPRRRDGPRRAAVASGLGAADAAGAGDHGRAVHQRRGSEVPAEGGLA